MRTVTSEIDVARASSLTDALRRMRDEERTPIAGATDLYVAANLGTLATRRLVDIWGLSELREISLRIGSLVIGALATYSDVIRSPQVAIRLPMLIDAARQVAAPQIRNRGTIGGNIANASATGDSLPVFAAVDATIVLRSLDGQRRVPFTSFYTDSRSTVRRPDELIVAVEVPHIAGRQWFEKVSAAQGSSKIVVAGIRGPQLRIAISGVAPTVVRARETERILAESGDLGRAAAALERELSPHDAVQSVNLLRRFWSETDPAAPGASEVRQPL
jgi:CO/xanthine dehydrogenase FAD-binding subunit